MFMRYYRLTKRLAALALSLGFILFHAPQHAWAADPAPFFPGEITVGLQTDVVLPAGNQFAGLDILDIIPLTEPPTEQAESAVLSVPTTTVLILQTEPGTEYAELERLAEIPGVTFALPNWTVYAAGDPFLAINDPLYENEQWYTQRIGAARAWALAQQLVDGRLDRLTPIRVAVVDSGVDFTHRELVGKLATGWNYINPGSTPQDDYGHGTHMSGVIAAGFNNNRGLAGLAPAVQILPYRALDENGSGRMSDVAAAIRAAADNNVRIINLSLFLTLTHPLLEDAVRYAHSQGVLLIASAGNCSLGETCPTPIRFPAAYSEVMAVGATTLYDTRAYYSSVGPELEITAPGGDSSAQLLNTWPQDQSLRCGAQNFRLEQGDAYCYATGTSSSAAVVSGVAALLLSVRPDLSAGQVRALLVETAAALAFPANEVGAGRLDAHAALLRLVPSDLVVSLTNIEHAVPDPSAQALAADARTLLPPPPAQPVTYMVTIINPSLEPIAWQASSNTAPWLSFGTPAMGTVRYGRSAHLPIVITPDTGMIGTFETTVWITGTRPDTSQIVQPIQVRLHINNNSIHTNYMPLASNTTSTPIAPQIQFVWEQPAPGQTRTVHQLTESSVSTLALPFTIRIKGRNFTDLRLSSDGFVSFPASENDPGPVNRCLTNLTRPSHLIAAWWGDLDPAVAQSRVSTFIAPGNRFVVEYFNVPLRHDQTKRISAQIVLSADGTVGLNYLQAPGNNITAPLAATVGIAGQYGRFYNQLYCARGQTVLGQLPGSYQSYLFQPENIY